MKKQILLLPFLVVALIFTGCSDDDDTTPNTPDPVNEQEVITTVEVTLSDGTNSYLLSWEDMDGDGSGEAVITTPETMPSGTYSGDIQLYNKTVDPSDDEYVVTAEILEEDLDHQFFFSAGTGLNVTTTYTDMDSAGNPIGQQFSMTATSGSGDFNVVLLHEPDKNAAGVPDGDMTNAGGDTDVNIVFPIVVQ